MRSARRHTPGEVASVEKDCIHVALPRIHGPIASSAFHCGTDHSISTAPTGDQAACRRPLSRTAQSRPPHAPTATSAARSANPSTPIVGTRMFSGRPFDSQNRRLPRNTTTKFEYELVTGWGVWGAEARPRLMADAQISGVGQEEFVAMIYAQNEMCANEVARRAGNHQALAGSCQRTVPNALPRTPAGPAHVPRASCMSVCAPSRVDTCCFQAP